MPLCRSIHFHPKDASLEACRLLQCRHRLSWSNRYQAQHQTVQNGFGEESRYSRWEIISRGINWFYLREKVLYRPRGYRQAQIMAAYGWLPSRTPRIFWIRRAILRSSSSACILGESAHYLSTRIDDLQSSWTWLSVISRAFPEGFGVLWSQCSAVGGVKLPKLSGRSNIQVWLRTQILPQLLLR